MFIQINLGRFELDKEQHRHWCPFSEPLTGGDALAAMLDQGWKINGTLCYHQQQSRRGRAVHQYSFCLQRDFHMVRITVISNPYVLNLIAQHGLRVIEHEPELAL